MIAASKSCPASASGRRSLPLPLTSMLVALTITACGSGSKPTSEPTVVPPELPEAPTDPLATAHARLADPPQQPGPVGQAFVELARALEVGAVRCPSAGAGRVRRIYGSPRDRLDLGIAYRLQQPSDPVPWSPYFDDVGVEDGWVVFLAEPGSTSGYLRASPVVQHMTWPPAKPGETVVCTSLEAVPGRQVTGRAEPAEKGTVQGSCSMEPVALEDDGTFTVDASTPCALWILTSGHRSSTITVGDDETTTLELGTIQLEVDPYQLPDGSWTEAGRERLREIIEIAEADVAAREHVMSQLNPGLATNAIQFWRGTLHTSRRNIDTMRRMLVHEP